MDTKRTNRFMELEGLRGLAALAVVLGHYIFAFYPMMILGYQDTFQHMNLEDNIHGTPIAILYSGGFAVMVFFVLSGFVLTTGFFQTKKSSIIKTLAARRYLRLMLPALASVMLCYVLMKLSLDHVDAAASISHSEWLAITWQFSPSFFDALYNGTIGIFIQGSSQYNNVLWTMSSEFIGSFIVFGYVLLFGASKYRWIGYIGLCVFTFNSWYMAFIIGMVLADLHSQKKIGKRLNSSVITLLLVAGVFLGSFPSGAISGTIYSFLKPDILDGLRIDYATIYMTIGAALLICAVLFSERLGRLLRTPRISILGKYTFSLYLVHLSVLYVFTTFIFVKLQPLVGYNKAVLIAFVTSVPVIALLTIIFERYIDRPSIDLARRWAYVFEGKESFRVREKISSANRQLRFYIKRAKESKLVPFKYNIEEKELD